MHAEAGQQTPDMAARWLTLLWSHRQVRSVKFGDPAGHRPNPEASTVGRTRKYQVLYDLTFHLLQRLQGNISTDMSALELTDRVKSGLRGRRT
jgi:hypothetical protein